MELKLKNSKEYTTHMQVNLGDEYTIAHDEFTGTVIGFYETKEGKHGVVMQQVGTKVVHVYGLRWIVPVGWEIQDSAIKG